MDFTHFLAQFFGFFLVIYSISMFSHKQMFMEFLHDIEKGRPVVYLLSMFGLMIGLVMVLLHNVWSGSLLSIVVTVIGWVALLKSIFYLVLPQKTIQQIIHSFKYAQNYQAYAAIAFLIGAYLAVAGLGV